MSETRERRESDTRVSVKDILAPPQIDESQLAPYNQEETDTRMLHLKQHSDTVHRNIMRKAVDIDVVDFS